MLNVGVRIDVKLVSVYVLCRQLHTPLDSRVFERAQRLEV